MGRLSHSVRARRRSASSADRFMGSVDVSGGACCSVASGGLPTAASGGVALPEGAIPCAREDIPAKARQSTPVRNAEKDIMTLLSYLTVWHWSRSRVHEAIRAARREAISPSTRAVNDKERSGNSIPPAPQINAISCERSAEQQRWSLYDCSQPGQGAYQMRLQSNAIGGRLTRL